MADILLSGLQEAIEITDTDLVHIRTIAGVDYKIKGENLRDTLGGQVLTISSTQTINLNNYFSNLTVFIDTISIVVTFTNELKNGFSLQIINNSNGKSGGIIINGENRDLDFLSSIKYSSDGISMLMVSEYTYYPKSKVSNMIPVGYVYPTPTNTICGQIVFNTYDVNGNIRDGVDIYGRSFGNSGAMDFLIYVNDGSSKKRACVIGSNGNFLLDKDLTVNGAVAVKGTLTLKDSPTSGSQVISAGETWSVPNGMYMMKANNAWLESELYVSGSWISSGTPSSLGGFIYSNGSNVRIRNLDGSSRTVYYLLY